MQICSPELKVREVRKGIYIVYEEREVAEESILKAASGKKAYYVGRRDLSKYGISVVRQAEEAEVFLTPVPKPGLQYDLDQKKLLLVYAVVEIYEEGN